MILHVLYRIVHLINEIIIERIILLLQFYSFLYSLVIIRIVNSFHIDLSIINFIC